jgi:hypothetical protein
MIVTNGALLVVPTTQNELTYRFHLPIDWQQRQMTVGRTLEVKRYLATVQGAEIVLQLVGRCDLFFVFKNGK